MSLIRYWLNVLSHRASELSSSIGGIRMDWWPEYTLHNTSTQLLYHYTFISTRIMRCKNNTNKAVSHFYVSMSHLYVTVSCIHLLPRKTPENKPKSTVRVEADGDLARGVELALQLYRATQSADRRVRDLTNSQSERSIKCTVKPTVFFLEWDICWYQMNIIICSQWYLIMIKKNSNTSIETLCQNMIHQSHLNPGQHACGWDAEVQVGDHLGIGRFVNSGWSLARQVIWKNMNECKEHWNISTYEEKYLITFNLILSL